MMSENQVEAAVESSDEGPLDEQVETQETEVASSQEGAAATEESSVEKQPDTVSREEHERLQADYERSVKAYDELMGRYQKVESTARPLIEAKQKELEQIVNSEDNFQKRVDEIGVARALDERIKAHMELEARNREQQALQQEQQQVAVASWQKATNETDKYGEKQGLTPLEMQALRLQFGGFPAATPEQSVRLAKLAIDSVVHSRVGTKAEETLLRRTEEETRRKLANSPAGGAAVSNQPPTPGSGAEFADRMRQARERLGGGGGDL